MDRGTGTKNGREKMMGINPLPEDIKHEICNVIGIMRSKCELFLVNYQDGIYSDRSPEELLEETMSIMRKVVNECDRAAEIVKSRD